MKKLLTSLATIALIGGSVLNTTAFKQINHQPNINNKNTKTNESAANEDAEDIASKLFHKTIKLDPNVWLGKNLATDQANFNANLVKLGILSSSETQYVTWSNLNIKVAGWYWNEGFTVKKDSATATGSVAINASTGETTAQIAAKLSKATLQFNYDWWNGKSLKDNWAQIQQIIANEHLLTKTEASVVTGLASYKTISGAGQFAIQMHVNDGNTDSIATPHINVVGDGPSATTLASEVTGTYYLKVNLYGQYADSAAAEADFNNYLKYDSLYLFKNATITLPHVKLQGENPINSGTASLIKDGQTAQPPSFTIDTENYPHIEIQNQDLSYLTGVVTLTPKIVTDFKQYFANYPGYTGVLQYFYQTLDDDQDPFLPKVPDVYFSTPLENEMTSYGDPGGSFTAQNILAYQADASDPGNLAFATALYNEINAIAANSYLTLDFTWYTTDQDPGSYNFTTENWGFW